MARHVICSESGCHQPWDCESSPDYPMCTEHLEEAMAENAHNDGKCVADCPFCEGGADPGAGVPFVAAPPEPSELDYAIAEAQRDLERNKRSLVRALQDLVDMTVRVKNYLDSDRAVNPLGEVQGKGFAVDRLCALQDEKVNNLARLQYVKAQG